ncbi:hypothetical protein [Streptomyces sp. IBSBF 2806]|uniref:hypothetical protein n=1 Tax=Streptomyces sp. IBSBF 2806 TaxID=2903529 RepID=UPI002FDC3A48
MRVVTVVLCLGVAAGAMVDVYRIGDSGAKAEGRSPGELLGCVAASSGDRPCLRDLGGRHGAGE